MLLSMLETVNAIYSKVCWSVNQRIKCSMLTAARSVQKLCIYRS